MRILDKIASGDGATKFLLELDDDSRIEAVFLRLEDNDKDSLCISSQVGCALACRFCSTGVIGYGRDLTAQEIVDQVELILDDLGFVQRRRFDLSYMGMGEPLLNLDAVVSSKDLLRERFKDFTFYVSTVGVTAGIRELARRSPDFGLQISLHAPTDGLRSQIMPINRAHPIAELLSAGEGYAKASGHSVVLNYCLMGGVNDDPRHASSLAQLIAGRPFRVQLVNFNPHVTIPFSSSTDDRALAFLDVLRQAGIRSHYGRQLGKQDGAGCGQLDADYAAGQFGRRHKRTRAIS
jgi:23S rRNA (adenine2503-C2)-methyltransferase